MKKWYTSVGLPVILGLGAVTAEAGLGEWIEAASAVELHGCRYQEGEEPQPLGWCDNGDWASFAVDLGQDKALGFEVEYGVPPEYAGQRMHLRLSSAKGETIGTVVFPSTGEWDVFKTHAIPVMPVSGEQKLCLAFQGRTGICNLKRFRFLEEAPPLVVSGLATAGQALQRADDAGTAESPLVIRSQDPDRPAVLTGGVPLSKWMEVEDGALVDRLPESARGKALVCDLAAHGVEAMGALVFGGFSSARAEGDNHRFGTFPVPELFYDGEPQTMARWPNDRLTRLPINEAPKEELDRFRRWAKETDLWLHGYWSRDWADAYEKVEAIENNGTIRPEPPTNRYGFGRRQGCAVNALCELDHPGEWYLDVAENRVVYLPPEGFDPKQCVLSCYNTVINAKDCSHLQIRDLVVNFVRGDALIFLDCSHLLVKGLDIRDCSGLGLRIRGGKHQLVHSCRIESMGRGGIDLFAGDWRNLDPAYSVVENCHISNLSRIDRTYTPALLLEGMGLKVRHSVFIDIPSSAIRLEACDALIEMNYFRRCVYESGDQGSIDMWANPLYRGNIMRWNDFDSIINRHAHLGAAAVRCDDYISGTMIAENVMRKGSPRGFGSVQFNQGTDNYVEGNIIVDWRAAFSGRSRAGSQWKARITGHPNSKRMLAETPWQSEAWRKKYPMVRDLMNGDDNRNYLVGNLRLGSGSWGGVSRALSLANRDGGGDVHGDTLDELKPHLVPWHPIPLDLIGPYDE